MFSTARPTTPQHAKMRGDKSPIVPPITPLPTRWQASPSDQPVSSSSTGRLLAVLWAGFSGNLKRSNSGVAQPPPAAALPEAMDKPHIGLHSNGFDSYGTSSVGNTSSSKGGGSSGSCENEDHRQHLARLTANIQRADQQQLRLTGVSVAVAVGLFYLLLERLSLKQLSVSSTLGGYIPLLHLLPALCAFCIVWIRLPRTRLHVGWCTSSADGAFGAGGSPVGLEEELMQKHMSKQGLSFVRQSEEVQRRFGSCLLCFLACVAGSDFFAGYVQFWPIFYVSSEVKPVITTFATASGERPPLFGPPPPGVFREGFERYPPENTHISATVSSSAADNNSTRAFVLHAPHVFVVLAYLLRALAAAWVLRAAHIITSGTDAVPAGKEAPQKQKPPGGDHEKKWTRYTYWLPGRIYVAQKLCLLRIKDGSPNAFATYCCSVNAAKQLFAFVLSASIFLHLWRIPLSPRKPSGVLSAFSPPAPVAPSSSSTTLLVGMLCVGALQLLSNALLPFIQNVNLPLLNKLRPFGVRASLCFSPPSSAAAYPASAGKRPLVQRACRSLFVAGLLLEIFSLLVGVRAVFYLFLQSGSQVQLLASAAAASRGERMLVCIAAVAHTLAAFVFASAGACCGMQNYLLVKIFRYGKVVEQEELGERK